MNLFYQIHLVSTVLKNSSQPTTSITSKYTICDPMIAICPKLDSLTAVDVRRLVGSVLPSEILWMRPGSARKFGVGSVLVMF